MNGRTRSQHIGDILRGAFLAAWPNYPFFLHDLADKRVIRRPRRCAASLHRPRWAAAVSRSERSGWRRMWDFWRSLLMRCNATSGWEVVAVGPALSAWLPAQAKVTDVTTPVGFKRYAGDWQGSTCGRLLTPQIMRR